MIETLLTLAGAAAIAFAAIKGRIWHRKQWVETSYYQWVRATRRGERTTTTRGYHPNTGVSTHYWVLE